MTMRTPRKTYSAEFKAKVAVEAIRGLQTMNEMAAAFGVHPHGVAAWRKQARQERPQIFANGRARQEKSDKDLRAALYQQIGQLKVELDWLKKNLDLALEVKRQRIESGHPTLSIARQCERLGLTRSSFYYQGGSESAENLRLMHWIDEQYTRHPFYGVRRMTAWLNTRDLGGAINHKRVPRWMRQMGIAAIYPKPRLSRPGAGHRLYPYLLRGVAIVRADQVWSTDITYIRLRHGLVYLVAIMDGYSRYVVSWERSNRLEVSFCLEALPRALAVSQPEIFNRDQGVQFTSQEFTGRLEGAGVKISMDGRGRVFDNIFIERLWRSVKYEDVYLKDYAGVLAVRDGLRSYFGFYNRERLHQALDYRTPETVYGGRG